MNEFEKNILKGFLDENWQKLVEYIDEHCPSMPAQEVANIYNNILKSIEK